MKTKIFFFLFLFLSQLLFPQAGHIDPTFNPTDHGYGGEASAGVNTVCLQPDGKILIGGDFTAYNGLARNRIVRLNADGSTDVSFNIGTGAVNTVHCIVRQADGKIIIGGDFASYNGVSRNRIARLNNDGSLDTTFNPGTGPGSTGIIYAIAIQNDGKIVVGGSFLSFNGTTVRRVTRLNSDGSIDTTFNPGGVGAGPSQNSFASHVRNLRVLPDGKILVTGDFITYNGVTRNRIARLNADGTLDTTFDTGTGAGSSQSNSDLGIKTVVFQPDGKMLLGGGFSSYNGTTRRGIVRTNANATSLDASFNPGTGAVSALSSAERVNSILLQSDGKMIIAGNIQTYNGNTIGHIARINSDGSFDSTFNPGGGATTNLIKMAVQQPDGKIIIVGTFIGYNSKSINRITRLNEDGTLDTTFNTATGFDGRVWRAAVQNDGKIVVGGYYTSCNQTPFQSLVRMDADGELDPSFNVGGTGVGGTSGLGGAGVVFSVSIQPDQKIIIAGDFTTYNTITKKGIARLNADGSIDFTFGSGTGPNTYIDNTYVQPDGKIIVVGTFSTYDGSSRIGMARLNANGSLDTTFNPVTSLDSGKRINAIAIQPDGKFIVVGTFTVFNGTTANRIVRLNADGTQDTSFNTGAGADAGITAVSISPDGKILICGVFHNFNGTTTGNSILRLNSDGTVDSSFYTGTGSTDFNITNMVIQADGKIIISGFLTNFNNVTVNHLARLNADGSLDSSFYMPPSTSSLDNILTSVLQPDGKLIIGGDFTSYGGVGRNRLARIFTTTPVEDISIVNLKAFIQGYYKVPDHLMTPVKANRGIGSSVTDVDNFMVELRDATTFELVSSVSGLLKTDGTLLCNFPDSITGNYFVAIKGTNTIETWSSGFVNVGADPAFYDFTTSASQAYGSNMAELEPGVFGFYSGDINQDGNIDTIDYPIWEMDSNNFVSGVAPTDLNGDGNVDTIDYPIWEFNSNNFISVARP